MRAGALAARHHGGRARAARPREACRLLNGRTPHQVRQKLGAPKEAERDEFFVFSDAESAQVFYDAQRVLTAVSANYLGEQSGAPTPEKVFGSPAEVKPDGSIYKMVRYTQAGYFAVYSRTPGDAPLVMITMQKIIE